MPGYVPVVAKAHTPPYKIHRYFARRPWNVFKSLIQHFSEEGDIIVDPFCGGGVTMYEGLNAKRRVIGNDINPLSTYIIQHMIRKNIDLPELKKKYLEFKDFIKSLYNDYDTARSDQSSSFANNEYIDWYEIAHIVKCNLCNQEVILSNENKVANGRYSCKNSACKGSKGNNGFIEPKNCERNGYVYLYSVKVWNNKKRDIKTITQTLQNKINEHINTLKSIIQKNNITIPSNPIPLNWDRQFEDLLERKGIINFEDLFTTKNLYINLLIWNKIKTLEVKDEIKQAFRFIYSNSIRLTNIMTFTNEGWASGKPNAWAKHAYWIPSQFCEVNIISAFEKSYTAYVNCLTFNQDQDYTVKAAEQILDVLGKKNFFLTNNLQDLSLLENKVDVIITDPPYGSNVQYLELSHFWYPWNKDLYKTHPNFDIEAVVNRKQKFEGAKDFHHYEHNLTDVFKMCYKILKPNKMLVMTFNNKDIRSWLALLVSVFRAGFTLIQDGIVFQDGVKNYKQTAHTKAERSPYGDFIYIFKKLDTNNSISEGKISEDELVEFISSFFEKKEVSMGNKNLDLSQRVLKIIPKLSEFARTLDDGSTHDLYSHFRKDYFEKFF